MRGIGQGGQAVCKGLIGLESWEDTYSDQNKTYGIPFLSLAEHKLLVQSRSYHPHTAYWRGEGQLEGREGGRVEGVGRKGRREGSERVNREEGVRQSLRVFTMIFVGNRLNKSLSEPDNLVLLRSIRHYDKNKALELERQESKRTNRTYWKPHLLAL